MYLMIGLATLVLLPFAVGRDSFHWSPQRPVNGGFDFGSQLAGGSL